MIVHKESTVAVPEETGPRALLSNLLNYIEEQAKDIDPRVYRLSTSKGFRRSRTDLVGLPGVDFDIKVTGDHIWLRVERLMVNRPPPLPDEKVRSLGVIRIASDPHGGPPSIDQVALDGRLARDAKGASSEERQTNQARDRAAVELALAEYLPLWHAWAEGEKPRRKTIALYGDLFSAKHHLESEETGKPSEFVWGMGIAAWTLKFEKQECPFEYPLLTQQLEVAIDEKTMALEVRPRITDTRFEADAFVACQVPGAAEVDRSAREQLSRAKDRPVSPFDAGSYEDVLKLAATNLDSHGTYRPVLSTGEEAPTASDHMVVTDDWAVFVRPRTNNFLIEDLRRLRTNLEAGCEIPGGPASLVTPASDEAVDFGTVNFRGLSSRGEGKGKCDELFFPLPYNQEQVTIVHQLERADGVSVQGPPGTGKTHTIANIICHYLATGRRVLVTSRGEQALEVLQEKIPDEVRPLTVALLTSDRESLRQFQASIEAIQYQVSQLNPELTRQEIQEKLGAIDRAHSELGGIDRRVDTIALDQLSEIDLDGQPLRAHKLAELVVHGRDQHGWFDDSVTMAAENAPPLSEAESARLREARRRLGNDLTYAEARVPSADALLPPNEIARLHDVLVRMRTIEGDVERGALLPLKATTPEVLAAARDLLTQVDEALALLADVDGLGEPWPHDLRKKCRLSSFASERGAFEALFGEIDALAEARAEFLKRPVECPTAAVTAPKTREAVARGAQTGKPFGMLSFASAEVKEHIAQVRVAGRPPSSAGDWAHVSWYQSLHDRVESFLVRWNTLTADLHVPTLGGGVAALRRIEVVATAARKAHRIAVTFDGVILLKAGEVFASVPADDLAGTSAQLTSVRQQIWRHLTHVELSEAATQLSVLTARLAGTSGPVSLTLRRFIEDDLGTERVPPERIAARYAEIVAEIRRVEGLGMDLAVVLDESTRIGSAGAPRLAARIRAIPVAPTGDDTTFPVTWRQAWTWARLGGHLEAIEAREELVTLSGRRRDLETGLARLYREMVGKSAWLATKRNATPKVLQALSGYATAIRRIGQGTGPNATRYRRDAREAMNDAAGAVPCWIMSHAKVSESMPPDIGAFDLVIVDEASQSNLWALPAILRGAKVLVVGDDKQVSPDGGFIASEHIQTLRDRYLGDQPYQAEMTPEKSLYDLAARVFSAHSVMLREHFRCVPPIIAYSNRVFYKGGIQPLRIAKSSERLDPPLVDIFVADGARDDHDYNRREAEVIVDEIAALLSDPRFAGRSLGVVSLLGMEQAKRVDGLVRQRCDAAELIRRRFVCGDPRTFQGSERDIMFVSMVADPGACKALSGLMFEQRFNVAASRARDRMYLVRSVELQHLSERDIRHTLLSHFEKPIVTDQEEAKDLIDRCESGFERQVFAELVSRGYRVIPQVKTGAYRIDMVVEGAGDVRLAIECDGDEFHGPDRWSADMNRQRVLERAGWTFWRCFASTWQLRRDEVMDELVARLGNMGIEPLGSLDRVPLLVEKRVVRARAGGQP